MSQTQQEQDFHLRLGVIALAAIAIVCAAVVTSCEMQNRAMVEITRINERAAEKGLEPFSPSPFSPIRDYRPKGPEQASP